MIEAYLESKRKDLPGYPGGVQRWVLHTDKLMVRYINEGKAVYYAAGESKSNSKTGCEGLQQTID